MACHCTSQERKDLEKLSVRDPTLDAREAWKSEISVMFRELNEKLDGELARVRAELESQFRMKVCTCAPSTSSSNTCLM